MSTEIAMQALQIVGGITLLRVAFSVFSFLYVAFLRPGKNLKKLGSWAVVTVSAHKPRRSPGESFPRVPNNWPIFRKQAMLANVN